MKYKYTPFIICTAILLLFVAAFEWLAMKRTGGHFSYPLDDAFIHMSVSKNLALHGVWGPSPHEWVSTSSSPLFTSLLAFGFLLFGVSIYTPFVISLIGGILVVFFLNKELNQHSTLSPVQKILCILITIMIATLPGLSLLGMEHTLQIAVTLAFVHAAATYLPGDNASSRPLWKLAVLGALMIATRYENAFIVITVCGILFLNKKYIKAILLGFICILPIILFGALFYSKGGFPIPNSVLLKGNNRYGTFLAGYDSISSLSGSLGGLLIITCILAFNKLRNAIYDRDFYLLTIFIVTTLLHSLFGKFGWFFRYEAYLIVMGVFLLLRILFQEFEWKKWKQPANLIIGLFFLIFCCNLGFRMLNSWYRTPGAIHNIYDQQYQMGQFVKQYYNDQTVAVNDVGAVSFFSDSKVLDLIGLASNEVTKADLGKYKTTKFLQEHVAKHNAAIVIIFDSWFDPTISESWIKVAQWKLPYNVISGSDVVSFYAVNQQQAVILKNNLLQFERERLPKENRVSYFE